MSGLDTRTNPFLTRLIAVIESHMSDEAFGVAELADEMAMSRSTLLRRVKKDAGVSVAIFIRQVRLRKAKELLSDDSLTVSEIAYQVGFSSSSYFAKCFREEYGYPPGEESKQGVVEAVPVALAQVDMHSPQPVWLNGRVLAMVGGLLVFVGLGFLLWRNSVAQPKSPPKTIAVLPFQNDSPDSSNVYVINGLMAALIDNLHQVDDIQVTSRTTVERYRGVSRTIPELAEELGVSYFVEGSGQKIGNQILLTLRLVDALADTLIWARRYKRETTDIFQLQTEVSTSIVQEIEVFITPEEQQRLAQPPTDNLVAYDYYLRGLEQVNQETRDSLIVGIESFKLAIAEDPDFANPYASMAIAYYFLDLFQVDQSHVEDINTYADKAIVLDPSLMESLIAKALYHMRTGQHDLAVQYFNKVLDQYPGLGWVHNLLSTIYILHQPNSEKYLRHAIQGIRYAVAGQDSGATSMSYLHLTNALAQNGFLEEALPFVEKSLSYNPRNHFAATLSIYVEMGQTGDLEKAFVRFQDLLAQDSSAIGTWQELGKLAFYQRNYLDSWAYYKRFMELRDASGLNIYQGVELNTAFIMDQLDRPAEADSFRQQYFEYLQKETSIYKELGLAAYHATKGETVPAMESMKAFAEEDGYQYWFVMFIEEDPILEMISTDPEYDRTLKRIQEKFWAQHRQMREVLEEEGVI